MWYYYRRNPRKALCDFASRCIFAVNNSENSGWSFDARRTSARPVAAQM
jgi:hypothetical protein